MSLPISDTTTSAERFAMPGTDITRVADSAKGAISRSTSASRRSMIPVR
jgi:hypothetical protein